MAQGIALSMTSGNMQPIQDGSWTKRMHPGLSGASGVMAATLAQQGYVGPTETYEGRFGLFPCFLGAHAKDADLNIIREGLGQRWEFPRTGSIAALAYLGARGYRPFSRHHRFALLAAPRLNPAYSEQLCDLKLFCRY